MCSPYGSCHDFVECMFLHVFQKSLILSCVTLRFSLTEVYFLGFSWDIKEGTSHTTRGEAASAVSRPGIAVDNDHGHGHGQGHGHGHGHLYGLLDELSLRIRAG